VKPVHFLFNWDEFNWGILESLNPLFIDHDEFKWISLEQLSEFDFAPADRVFVEKLKNGKISIKT